MTKTELRNVMADINVIALVGASHKAHRPSYEVMAFLIEKGFKVYPVNPVLAGQKILNQKVHASLKEIPEKVDMVDIFRNSKAAGETCDEVLSLPEDKKPGLVWMQIGVINEAAAKKLIENNITVVMDECPKQILS